ncbi:MAG: ABC transporter substrate-binding protein [Lachnospiraceae bacterium]|nr:ABC transporter substrate-binding protein [Lachnospiraceae bacterium]
MKRKLLLALLLFSMTTALCACKGGTDKGDTPGDISSGTPANGGEIVVGITQDLDSLDPHIAVAAGTDEVLFNIFEGLIKPDKDGNFVEAVAEKYVISEDAMTYTFTLRENVKFHNGDTVTVDDVVYSLKRCAGLLDVQDPNVLVDSALSRSIKEIVVVDSKTVELKLHAANTELLPYLTCAIIPCDYDAQATSPVGTGPFKFVSYAPLESFIIEKNADYYGTPAYLDKVTFKIYANSDAAFLELMAGNVHIFPYLTDEQATQLSDKYSIEVGTMNLVQALFLNNGVAPFDDVRVRTAICHAVNRQEILDMLSGGRGTIINSGMTPGLASYYNNDVAGYSYSVEKAKQLLADAGYADGLEITITVPSNYQYHMDTAQVIVEQLKKVGVTAKIEPVEWATWLSDVYKGRDYQATVVGLDFNLAPSDVVKRYQSTASNNFVNYVNEAYDTTFAKALAAVDEQEKIAAYKELQKLLFDDAASVYIQDPALLTAVSKELGGYTFYPVYVQDMSLVYFVK